MLGDVIKIERIKLGWSQQKLGGYLAVTQQAVGKWEKNLAEPDAITLDKLATLFGVSTDYLLGRDNPLIEFTPKTNNIRTLRKQYNLTLKQLGNIVNLGESTISLYENGKREPDFETTCRLADYFGVSIDYLLGRNNTNTLTISKINRLKSLREKANYTQNHIANKLKIAPNTYSQYENGKRQIPDNLKIVLADLYGVSLDYLLGRELTTTITDSISCDKIGLIKDIMELNQNELSLVTNFVDYIKNIRKK